MKGKFIVIDGGDGSGKGTAIDALKACFTDRSRMIFTREPGGTPYAEDIRKLILLNPLSKEADANTMFALFLAARCDHVAKLVRPSIRNGVHVVSDRFDASTFSFQIYAQGGFHLLPIFEMAHEAFFGDVRPDLYIYLDVDPEEGARRTANREEVNHFDARKVEFYAKSREGYLSFISNKPSCIIDANRSIECVTGEVVKIVQDIVGKPAL
jgi:dTMP kinase